MIFWATNQAVARFVILSLLNLLFNFFIPRFCIFCHQEGDLVCPNCRSQFKYASPKCPLCFKPSLDGSTHPRCLEKFCLDGLTSLYQYRQKEIQHIIKEIKYRFYYRYIDTLLSEVVLSKPLVDFLVPLPLHSRRYNWRGFNQADKICEVLERKWNLPTYHFLVRSKATKPLAEISSSKDRKQQIKDAFSLNPKVVINIDLLKGKTVLLVDDVYTSGASLGEACRVLKKAGVQKVWGWTLAA